MRPNTSELRHFRRVSSGRTNQPPAAPTDSCYTVQSVHITEVAKRHSHSLTLLVPCQRFKGFHVILRLCREEACGKVYEVVPLAERGAPPPARGSSAHASPQPCLPLATPTTTQHAASARGVCVHVSVVGPWSTDSHVKHQLFDAYICWPVFLSQCSVTEAATIIFRLTPRLHVALSCTEAARTRRCARKLRTRHSRIRSNW